jgi:flagellar biogenesis protein FliO
MDKNFLEVAMKMMTALGVVLVVFGALAYAYKKFLGGRLGWIERRLAGAERNRIEILATKSLAPGRILYLVQCQDRQILVGATGSQLSCLSEFNEIDSESSSFMGSLKDSQSKDSNIHEQLRANLKDISRV